MDEASTELGVYDKPWFTVWNGFFALWSIVRLRSASWLVGGMGRVVCWLAVRWVWIVLRVRWVWVIYSSLLSVLIGWIRVVLNGRIRGREGSWRWRKGRLGWRSRD